MDDDTLIALAQQRFDDADRNGATHEECQLMRDIFPAVIQRLREKVEITRDFVAIDRFVMEKPKGWEKQANVADQAVDDDQLQLSLRDL